MVLRCCGDELEPEFLSLAIEMGELPDESAPLVGFESVLDVFLALGHHEVDEAGKFARGGGDGWRRGCPYGPVAHDAWRR